MTARSRAAKRAEALVGQSTPHGESGWCLEWCVQTVHGHYGPYRWGGNGAAWAINYWDAAKRWGRVVQTSDPARVPRGALTFTKGRSKYGHVVIALGDGWCASTDYPTARKIGRVRFSDLLAGWGHQLLGYIDVTGDGLDLSDPGPVDHLNPAGYYLGAHGDHVLWMGRRLVAHGIARYTPTRDFTRADVRAVALFQKAQGWTGSAADGLPGAETLRRLDAHPAGRPASLAGWKWTGPVGRKGRPVEWFPIGESQYAPYFVQLADRLRFFCPVDGVTTPHSDNPRSELRQMDGHDEAAWSTTSGSHGVSGEFAVNRLPGAKTADYKPGVVVAQIHDDKDDVVMVLVQGTTIYASWSKGKGRGSEKVRLLTGYQLGQRVRFSIEAAHGVISVRVDDHLTTKRISKDDCYAKAGAYCQGNESNATGATQVDYFDLKAA